MSKHLCMYVILLLMSFSSIGQNLLNNPAFELNTGNIQAREMDFTKVNNWDAFVPSPDYIGASSVLYTSGAWPTPTSGLFYIAIGGGANYKESVGQQVSLAENVSYRIRFKATSLWGLANVIELYGFDQRPTNINNNNNLNYFGQHVPLWQSDTLFGDSVWHIMEGCFTASKDLKYIVLTPKATTTTTMFICLDDVSIQKIESPFDFKKILPADTVICNNAIATALNPVGLDSIIRWSDGSTNKTFFADTSGVYSIRGIKNGCVYEDSIAIIFKSTPAVLLPNDTFFCDSKSIEISAKIVQSTVSYQIWNNNQTGLSIMVNTQGWYWIEVGNECGIHVDSIFIENYFSPVIDLGPPIANCEKRTISINAWQAEITDYLWSDGAITPNNNITDGNIWLKVTNVCGSATDTLWVNNSDCNCKVNVPNAFSPTNDGLNENFTLLTNCTDFSGTLRIYNRWGEKIFTSSNLKTGWDGSYKGAAMSGVYLAVFEIYLPGNKREIISKTIHLIN